MFDIFNKSGLDLGPLEDLMQEFMPFAQERHGFQHPPKLFLLGDEENAANPLGKTGGYNPDSMEVTLYVSGRHPKDILRSLSHELVHHNQNDRGDLSDMLSTALGYAQEDPHMREMEREAYEQGNLCFRDWEDGRKKQLQESIYYETIIGGNDMSEQKPLKEWKDNEINTRLMKKFGLLKEEGTAGDDFVVKELDITGEKTSDDDDELNEEDDEEESISGLERNSTNETLSRLNEEVVQILKEDWASRWLPGFMGGESSGGLLQSDKGAEIVIRRPSETRGTPGRALSTGQKIKAGVYDVPDYVTGQDAAAALMPRTSDTKMRTHGRFRGPAVYGDVYGRNPMEAAAEAAKARLGLSTPRGPDTISAVPAHDILRRTASGGQERAALNRHLAQQPGGAQTIQSSPEAELGWDLFTAADLIAGSHGLGWLHKPTAIARRARATRRSPIELGSEDLLPTTPPPIPGSRQQLDDIVNRMRQPEAPRSAPRSASQLKDDWFEGDMGDMANTEYVRPSEQSWSFRNIGDKWRSWRRPDENLVQPNLLGPDGRPMLDVKGRNIVNPDVGDFAVHPDQLKRFYAEKHHADIDANPNLYAQHLYDQTQLPHGARMAVEAGGPIARPYPDLPFAKHINRPISGGGPNRSTGFWERYPYSNPAGRLFGGSGARRPFTGYGLHPLKWALPGLTAAGVATLNPEEAAMPYIDERGELASKSLFQLPHWPQEGQGALGIWKGDPTLGRPGSPTPSDEDSRIWDRDQIYEVPGPDEYNVATNEDGEVVARQMYPGGPWKSVKNGRELSSKELEGLNVALQSTRWDSMFDGAIEMKLPNGRTIMLTPPTGWKPEDEDPAKNNLHGYLEERGIKLSAFKNEIINRWRARQEANQVPDGTELAPPPKRDDLKKNTPYTWDDLNESLELDENYYNTLFEGIKNMWTKETKE